MTRTWKCLTVAGVVTLAFLAILFLRYQLRPRSRFDSWPRVTLWAWETPSDLRDLDPQRYAVAYLEDFIFIGDHVEVVPRRQPLAVAQGMKLMAVVRIEVAPGANLNDPELLRDITSVIVAAAGKRKAGALQIDFDARQSQREFYRKLLTEIRSRLPKEMPLSMTALASWCAYDDWIGTLPVDEAVPMYFRMGPEHRVTDEPGWTYPVRESLCVGRAGVSTDEAWPKLSKDTRVYVFHPRPWSEVARNNVERYLK